jgi:uncharacterized damage-inducible protein DinB
MPAPAVAELVYLLDQAFEANDEHSLLGNLSTVTAEDWRAQAPEGSRSIRALAAHAGVAKYLYADHLFGAATLTYRDALRRSPAVHRQRPMADAIDWLRDGHRLLRDRLLTLTDADLALPRRTHWGEVRETRGILSVLIMHDVYHAGEINHLRALRQDDDRWPWEPRESPSVIRT